tara:strand:- start:374 stop:832 length:459 start_codon:yes stop_codon:yes gene_type:complete
MPIVSPSKLKANVPPGASVLGLDFGSKTIGLAIADPTFLIASPFGTIKRGKFMKDFNALQIVIDSQNIGGLVCGLPIGMDGSEGPRCQSTRQFVKNFLSKIDIAVAFWDERLSTIAVERVLIGEVDMSRERRKKVIDKLAAAYILQGALDSL